MTDQQIVAEIQAGNHNEPLNRLYRHFPLIQKMVVTHGGDEEEAYDIFQDALMVLIEKIRSNRFELTASLKTYLYSVCKYKLYDKNRKHKVLSYSENLPEQAEEPQHEDSGLMAELERKFEVVDRVLANLGEKCVEILRRFYHYCESMDYIADQLGYANVNTVKTQKYKCLERAKKMATGFFGGQMDY
ncbi:sigma-70 family RNA polymerase sigma factor [bacterium]|nr:sigma-70 family RNA polymerase sigma factor [bacterium]